MDGDVMVEPAKCDQIVHIGPPAMGPGNDVMDLEPVSGRAALHGATTVTTEDMTAQFPAHRPRPSSQIERSALLGDLNQVDIPVTEDPFEHSRSDSRSGHDGNTALSAGFDCRLGVDDHRNVDRCAFL
jgi:hypothetical protein